MMPKGCAWVTRTSGTFFKTLFLRYNERFVYAALDIKNVTQRLEWAPASTALQPGAGPDIDYPVRVAE